MHLKLITLFCFCSFFAFAQSNTATQNTPVENKIDYKAIGAPMPLLLLGVPDWKVENGVPIWVPSPPIKVISNKDIPTGANQFIMIFNPNCEHCMDETTMLEKNISLFKKTRIYMVAAPDMTPYISDFDRGLNVYQYSKTITLCLDYCKYIDNHFLYQVLPQLNIYDHQQKLIKIFSGDFPIDSLKKYIE